MLSILKGGAVSNTGDDQSSEYSIMRQGISGVEVVALTGSSLQNQNFKSLNETKRKSKTEVSLEKV